MSIHEAHFRDYRVVFERRSGAGSLPFDVTVHQHNGHWIKRYNTHEECAIQLVGYASVLSGHEYVRLQADHHVFEFQGEEHIQTTCITPDNPNDTFTIARDEVKEWMWGYAKCIWEHEFAERDQHAENALELNGDRISGILGEEPPFLRKIPEKRERRRQEQKTEDREAYAGMLSFAVMVLFILFGIPAIAFHFLDKFEADQRKEFAKNYRVVEGKPVPEVEYQGYCVISQQDPRCIVEKQQQHIDKLVDKLNARR